MEKLLVLGSSLSSNEIVEYAKSQGIYTIVTDYLPAEKSRAKPLADECWMINTGDLDVLEEKCRHEGVTAVMCGASEFNIEMNVALCERLGLPCFCTASAWHYSKDKADFKALCREEGAPVPEDYYISDALTDEEIEQVKFPVVVKPVDQAGNKGISYCYNKEDLIEAYKYARSVSNNPKIVVERMLKGKEWYTYYVFAEGKVSQICLNAMESEPGHLKNLYSLTTTITDSIERVNAEINPAIERVLKRVGCREGIAWVQLMLDEDNHFYIIEMGYRLPGDIPDRSYPGVFGFSTVKWLTDYARGIKLTEKDLPAPQSHAYKKCGSGYTLWTQKSGTITEVIGFDEVVKIPGVKAYQVRHIGDQVPVHSKVGVLVINADTIDEFCEKIKKINQIISVRNENGEDILIRYTDFDYLKETYIRGINYNE